MQSSMKFGILGGLLVAIDTMLIILKNLSGYLSTIASENFFNYLTDILNDLSSLLIVIFIILFFYMIFKKKNIGFIQKIMDNYPKISLYLHYMGIAFYILFIIDTIIFTLFLFVAESEAIKVVLLLSMIIIDVLGLIVSLVMATHKCFFNKKNPENDNI